jgi:hypothetical protein
MIMRDAHKLVKVVALCGSLSFALVARSAMAGDQYGNSTGNINMVSTIGASYGAVAGANHSAYNPAEAAAQAGLSSLLAASPTLAGYFNSEYGAAYTQAYGSGGTGSGGGGGGGGGTPPPDPIPNELED